MSCNPKSGLRDTPHTLRDEAGGALFAETRASLPGAWQPHGADTAAPQDHTQARRRHSPARHLPNGARPPLTRSGWSEDAAVFAPEGGAGIGDPASDQMATMRGGHPGPDEPHTDAPGWAEAEATLRRTEALHRETQRHSVTGSFVWNLADRSVDWSDETRRIYQYKRSSKPTLAAILQRIHPDDTAAFQCALAAAEIGQASIDVPHRLLMPDGTVKHVRAVAQRDHTCLGNLRYFGGLTDVTAVRRSEEALLRAQAELAHITRVATLGKLTASIAHEVNTPLAGIVLSGEACLRWLSLPMPNVEEARKMVQALIAEGRRASAVVTRLHGLMRKVEPQRSTVKMNDVINESVPLIRREVESKQTSLRLDLAPDLPPISGDRIQLQQVVINLMVNGIQAMAANSATPRELVVSTALCEADLKVAIRDTGTGIAPEHRDRVFQPFFTTKRDGMGMGLSICRSIIAAHGGRIWAADHTGPGAMMVFTVPVPSA
ncbi:MAG TPA: ATP-binding protein [Acetobacteraceae bacterium]|jgi:signal transduction histidine kinase